MTRTTNLVDNRHLLLVILIGPFYLNDLANIYITDWRWWLFIDYTFVKLLPLSLLAFLLYTRRLRSQDIGLTNRGLAQMFVVFLTVTIIATLVDQNGYALIESLPGGILLGGMPPIESRTWDWIDLTLGLLLVGIVEELVFRGYLSHYLYGFTRKPAFIVIVSSLAFGLIHWSAGLHAILITTVIGAIFMLAFLYARVLPPIMLAHFAVNFIDFAGVIPKSIFKFT